MNTAVFLRSAGPRVNIAPYTRFAHVVRRHAAMPQQLIDARIDRHHRVEHARLRIGVETERESWRGT